MLLLYRMYSVLLGIGLLGFVELSREPKFHHDEMFDGAGRSMNALFTIFISG